jgi:hypothetical protein
MKKGQRKKKKISEQEQQEIERSIELAELVKPHMENGLDVSLFTKKETELIQKLMSEHNRIFRKRAEELRFYPDTLNRKEKAAILRCMTYDELKPYYGIVAINEKNRRLQEMLALSKVDIRRYCRMTLQFSESGCGDEMDLPDISIARNTESYFAIMRERGEKTYEEPYYFLTDEHKDQVIRIYAKSISKDSDVEAEPKPLDQTLVKVDGGTCR